MMEGQASLVTEKSAPSESRPERRKRYAVETLVETIPYAERCEESPRALQRRPKENKATTALNTRAADIVAPVETVLILGDSHMMGYFGRVLHNRVSRRFGADVTMVGACGKSEPGFLKGSYTRCGVQIRTSSNRKWYPLGCPQNPCKKKHGTSCSKRNCRPAKLSSYLKRLKPDLVILQLGANSTWMGTAGNGWPAVRANIRKVVAKLKAAKARCVWITPPDTMIRTQSTQDKFTAMYEEELAGHCNVFNSRPSHRPYMHYATIVREMRLSSKQHDRMHYWVFGRRGRRIQTRWAQEVVSFTAQRVGPDATVLQDTIENAEKVVDPRTTTADAFRRQARRRVTASTVIANEAVSPLLRLRETERRRTRGTKSARKPYQDDSAHYHQ